MKRIGAPDHLFVKPVQVTTIRHLPCRHRSREDVMNPRNSLSAIILLALLAGWTAPAAAQPAAAPYVFFLLDTSGSMNYSPPCTQTQIDAGACGFLCPTGDCFVPMQGDDPASKLYQIKKGLYTSIAPHDDLL